MKGVFPIATEAYSQFIAILNITIFSYNIDVIDVRGRIQYFIISIRKCCCISDLATCISCPNSYFSQAFVSGFIIHIFDNELSSNFIIDIYGAIIVHNSVLRSLCACIFSALRFWSREGSGRNQSQHECCHGSQRYNLLRDLIQLYSLPINFPRNFACPHSGAGFLSGPVRLLRDSPPASALYVHDRVSGCARDWSNHPGLEICCGCIPPSDNVAMDHTSPHPPPQPRTGPIGSGTRLERPTGKNERSRAIVFSIQTQQVPAQ